MNQERQAVRSELESRREQRDRYELAADTSSDPRAVLKNMVHAERLDKDVRKLKARLNTPVPGGSEDDATRIYDYEAELGPEEDDPSTGSQVVATLPNRLLPASAPRPAPLPRTYPQPQSRALPILLAIVFLLVALGAAGFVVFGASTLRGLF